MTEPPSLHFIRFNLIVGYFLRIIFWHHHILIIIRAHDKLLLSFSIDQLFMLYIFYEWMWYPISCHLFELHLCEGVHCSISKNIDSCHCFNIVDKIVVLTISLTLHCSVNDGQRVIKKKLEGKFFLFSEQEKRKILKAFLRIPCQITHMSGFFCARISMKVVGRYQSVIVLNLIVNVVDEGVHSFIVLNLG